MKKKYWLIFTLIVFLINKSQSQCTFSTAVPYFESFASVNTPNQLPLCWTASNLGNTCLTYTSPQTQSRIPHTGTQFASFSSAIVGANYFYSNGILLNAGVTYSTSVWFITEYLGYTNWSDLSILIGPNQSTLGLVQVASTNTTAVAATYTTLANTFTVASSGIYYAAIRATSSSSIGAQYLTFDDFKMDSVCLAPLLNMTVSASTICAGQSVSLAISGADTYSWNTGATTQTIVASPLVSSNYFVIGTNTLTGCTATSVGFVSVNPSPNILVYASSPSVCLGSSATITALGANTYSWNTGQQTNSIIVTPSVGTVYTVSGSNSFSCTATTIQSIQINPLPIVLISPNSTIICTGDSVTLYASGALNYQWLGMNSGNTVAVSPSVSTNYSVTGTTAEACSNTATTVVKVSVCVGITSLTKESDNINVSPNPFKNELSIFLGNTDQKLIQIIDLNGQLMYSKLSTDERLELATETFASGMYYLKLMYSDKISVLKLIKP